MKSTQPIHHQRFQCRRHRGCDQFGDQFLSIDIADPITVKYHISGNEYRAGKSSPSFATVPYALYLTALNADAKDAADATAISHIPNGPVNPVNGNTVINVNTANLRAVGINVNPPAGSLMPSLD